MLTTFGLLYLFLSSLGFDVMVFDPKEPTKLIVELNKEGTKDFNDFLSDKDSQIKDERMKKIVNEYLISSKLDNNQNLILTFKIK